MRKVYCDSGGYRPELRELEAQGLVELCTYVYENKNRKVSGRAPASNPTWEQGDSTWDDCTGTWDHYGGSEVWPEILELVGPHNDTDAKHIDSAYKARCHALLTSDKGDISSKSASILALTGIRVFHAHHDWYAFLAFVRNAA